MWEYTYIYAVVNGLQWRLGDPACVGSLLARALL